MNVLSPDNHRRYCAIKFLLIGKIFLSGLFVVSACFWTVNFALGGLLCFFAPEALVTFGCIAFWMRTKEGTVGPISGVVLRTFWLLFFLTEVVFWGGLTGLLALGGSEATLYQLMLIFMVVLPNLVVLIYSCRVSLKIPLRPGVASATAPPAPPLDLSTTLPRETSQTGTWDQAKPGKQ